MAGTGLLRWSRLAMLGTRSGGSIAAAFQIPRCDGRKERSGLLRWVGSNATAGQRRRQ